MLGVVVVYAGLFVMLIGCVSLIKPLRVLRIATRKAGLIVTGAGMALAVVGMSLPAQVHSTAALESQLDEWIPLWQFSEYHELRVQAAPEQAWQAIHEVTADEIFLFRTLTWIRNPRWSWSEPQPEHILNPPGQKPILEVAQAGGFVLLREYVEAGRPREIVLGTVVLWDGVTGRAAAGKDDAETQSTRRGAEEGDVASHAQRRRERILLLLRTPGNAVAAINFRVRDEGGGWCTVTTETRVLATDLAAQRRFARYWRVIYPGSSLLRYTWLRAIKARAERGPG
jgi:hypothetical protein